MKLLSITLLASLFLFSCSDDDGGDNSGFQTGWTTERIDAAIKECESSDSDIKVDCRCLVEETAKIIPFDPTGNEIPTKEQSEGIAKAFAKCGASL